MSTGEVNLEKLSRRGKSKMLTTLGGMYNEVCFAYLMLGALLEIVGSVGPVHQIIRFVWP